MKKIFPLLSLSLIIFSCGSKDPYRVSKQEMLNAFAFKGVEYLQYKNESFDPNDRCVMTDTISPNRVDSFLVYLKTDDTDEQFYEKVENPDGTYKYLHSRNSQGSITKEEEIEESKFPTVQSVVEYFYENYFQYVDYDKCDYNQKKKCYIFEYKNKKFEINFKDKRLQSFSEIRDEFVNQTISFTYEEIVPQKPDWIK